MNSAAANNCVVVAIHRITGNAIEDIVAGLSSFPNEEGGPAFEGDGVMMSSVSAYLESLGWEERFFEHRPSIPWTCMISVAGHAFAVVDGRIYDQAGGSYDGTPIVSIFVPPALEGGSPKIPARWFPGPVANL